MPDSFNQFKINYRMNKIDFIRSELLNALQVVEGIIKGHPSVNNVEKDLISNLFFQGKGQGEKDEVLSNPNIILNLNGGINKRKKVNDPKPKGKCLHCAVVGHWKKNCPTYLAQKKGLKYNQITCY